MVGYARGGFVIVVYIFTFFTKLQGDRRESDGFQKKKKYSVDFQVEMDLFLQN
jgi:hypothetical protein